MKDTNQNFIAGIFLGLSLGVVWGIYLGGNMAERYLDKTWKEKAVKAGVGRYDDKTAKFKFIIVEDIKRVEVDE